MVNLTGNVKKELLLKFWGNKMKKHQEKLNVIDENDEVIGEETREDIHKKGLLHREIHIWIYNNKKEILFQKRAPDKDTFPNKLDASVGGHVDLGYNHEEAALKELKEETGINAKKENLIFLRKIRSKSYDPVTKNTNNVIRYIYAYKFKDNKIKLKLEKGQATSLEFWSIKKLLTLNKSQRAKFVPFNWEKYPIPVLKQINELE
mgnify:FL=1